MNEEFHKFVLMEYNRINIDKWIEGEKNNKDPGQEFVMTWISENALDFRKRWEQSKCRTCINCLDCGHNVLSAGDQFQN